MSDFDKIIDESVVHTCSACQRSSYMSSRDLRIGGLGLYLYYCLKCCESTFLVRELVPYEMRVEVVLEEIRAVQKNRPSRFGLALFEDEGIEGMFTRHPHGRLLS